MPVTAILFDKDGTLIDFEATFAPACVRVITDLSTGDAGRAIAMARAVGFDLGDASFAPDSIIIGGSTRDMAEAWSPLMASPPGADFETRIDGLFQTYTRETASPFPGVATVLAELVERGYRLGVATNDAEANAHAHVEAANLSRLLDFVAGYDSGHGPKPGPGMVQAFARHCGCETASVIMVGDSRHDMEAAHAAGAIAVGVTTGPATAYELAPHADVVISGLHELLGLTFFDGL